MKGRLQLARIESTAVAVCSDNYELEEDKRRAMQYYSLSLDANQNFELAREALDRLKRPDSASHS
jgi:hypothetical protein